MKFTAVAPLVLAPLAAAHGAVTSYIINGVSLVGYDAYYTADPNNAKTIEFQWPSYNPILDVTSAAMTCNGGTSAPASATVAAGQNVTAVWAQWTHQQGPVMVWLYKCSGSFGSGCVGSGKNWFKIDQMGLYGTSLTSTLWGTGIVFSTLKWSSKIPSNIPAGNYLIRFELLALHQANTPQFYPECAQIVVTGGGSSLPTSDYLYSIPGYATATDPGVDIDIYTSTATTYTCPGGPVWTGFT